MAGNGRRMADGVITAGRHLAGEPDHDAVSAGPPVQIAPPPSRSRRVRVAHVIGEQRLEVIAPPGIGDHALVERLSALNRARLLPVIERVFDEFDTPGIVTRIDRLAIDLGAIAIDALGELESRLVAALREALRDTLAGRPADTMAGDDVAAVARLPLGRALVEAFGHYLAHGAWPYGAGLDRAATPADCLVQLLREQPAATIALVRRRGADEAVLRRLVRQMPEAALAALLHRLEPDHAADVLGYIDEVRASHRVAPLVPATPVELDALLWTIVLRDAVHEPGLYANRKAFLARLLGQLAGAAGQPVAALIGQLRRGLGRDAARRHPASLVAVLADVIADDPSLLGGDAVLGDLADLLGGARRARGGELAALLAQARRAHRPELRWLLRRLARDDAPRLARHGMGLLGPAATAALLLDQAEATVAPVMALAATIEQQAALLRLAAAHGAGGGAPIDRAKAFAVAAVAAITRLRGARPAPGDPAAAVPEPAPVPLPGRRAGEPARPAAIVALIALLDDDAADDAALARALGAARRGDPIALRRRLRALAVADPRRLRTRLEGAAGDTPPVAWLLPAHLAAPLAALAALAGCGDDERGALVALAGRADDDALGEAIARDGIAALARRRGVSATVLRRRLRAADAGDSLPPSLRAALDNADTRAGAAMARSYAALEYAVLLWDDRAPFAAGARAAAIERLLPALTRLPPAVLPARLGGGIGAALAGAMTAGSLQRLALLLAPSATIRERLRDRLRRADPATLVAIVRDLAAGGTGTPPAPRSAHAPDPALVRILDRLSPAALSLLVDTLDRGGTPAAGDAAPHERIRALFPAGTGGAAPLLARVRALLGGPRARRQAAALVARWSARDRLRLILLLAPPDTGPGRAVRARLRAAETSARTALVLELLVALLSGEDIAPRREAVDRENDKRARLNWSATVRARPLDALRRIAAAQRDTLATAIAPLLAPPGAAALGFATLPPGERAAATAFGRLLTGRAGRSAIDPAKVARALAVAAGERDGRSAPGFTARWDAALRALATVGERRALAKLTAERDAITASTEHAAAITTRGRDDPELIANARADLAAPAAPARPRLRALARDARHRARLARALDDGALAAWLAVLAPHTAAALLHAAERIAAARRAIGAPLPRGLWWQALIEAAVRDPGRLAALVARLIDGGGEIPAVPLALRDAFERRLRESLAGGRDAALRAALERRAHDRTTAKRPDRPAPVAAAAADAILVANAGLVLASSYLPLFFRTLDLVVPDDDGALAWRSLVLRERAVHLLQWLVDERCDAPEPQLALNKLLCGIDPSEPVDAAIAPGESELAACRMLLRTIQAGWPPLGGSSLGALRETFLQRDGVLLRDDQGWTLAVERKVVDILLDQLPWGFSLIRHSWMPSPLRVDWRQP